jgi:predicted NUDIX family phosphoesterase
MTTNKYHTRYPSFILAIDAKAVDAMGMSADVLDDKPWWWFNDDGAKLAFLDETPNSALLNQHIAIRQRNALEKNENYLQILPYTLIGYAHESGLADVTTYFRKRGQGETRMAQATKDASKDVRSLGWGGHVEIVDLSYFENGDLDVHNTILTNIGRELDEECIFTDTRSGEAVSVWRILDHSEALKFCGFIRDTTNEVGRVHLAVVHFLTIPAYIQVKKRENEHLDGPVMSLNELTAEIDEFEPWSRIIINDHHLRREAVKLNLESHQAAIQDAQYHRLATAAGQEDVAQSPATILHETVLEGSLPGLQADAVQQ